MRLNTFLKRNEGLAAAETRRVLEDRLDDLLDTIVSEASAGESPTLPLLVDRALWLDELYEALLPALATGSKTLRQPQQLPKQAGSSSLGDLTANVPIYVVSSLFLEQGHDYLMRGPHSRASGDEPEWMALVSGVRFGPVRVCDLLLTAPLAYQSAIAAQLDQRQLSRLLRTLDRHGHALYMVIHSHTHSGPPTPSTTDLALQTKLEGAGYPVIQAVLSRTGHIRFFSNDQLFEVFIYGTGIERLDHRLYRLAEAPTGDGPRVQDEAAPTPVRR